MEKTADFISRYYKKLWFVSFTVLNDFNWNKWMITVGIGVEVHIKVFKWVSFVLLTFWMLKHCLKMTSKPIHSMVWICLQTECSIRLSVRLKLLECFHRDLRLNLNMSSIVMVKMNVWFSVPWKGIIVWANGRWCRPGELAVDLNWG